MLYGGRDENRIGYLLWDGYPKPKVLMVGFESMFITQNDGPKSGSIPPPPTEGYSIGQFLFNFQS